MDSHQEAIEKSLENLIKQMDELYQEMPHSIEGLQSIVNLAHNAGFQSGIDLAIKDL